MEIKNLLTPQANQQFSTAYQGIKKKVKPLTDMGTDLYNQNVEAIKPAVAQVKDTVNTSFVEPIKQPIRQAQQRTQAIYQINDAFSQAGLNTDDIKALAEDEGLDFNEVISTFQSNGIKVQGMDELMKGLQDAKAMEEKQKEDWYANKTYFGDQRKDEGVIEQTGKGLVRTPLTFAQNVISGPENIAQGALNLLDKTVGEGALNPILNVAGEAIKGDKYKPLPTWYNDVPSENKWTENIASNIIGAGKEALTTGKTYSQANEELKQQQYQAGKNQGIGGSLANIAGGGVQSAFNIMAPGTSALFAGAGEMPGTQYIAQGLGALTQAPIDYVVNKAGGTQETAEQLGTVANYALPLGRNKIAGLEPKGKVGKGLQNLAVKIADTIINPIGTAIDAGIKTKNTVASKYTGLKTYLAGLDDKTQEAIRNTSSKEMDDILKQANATVGKKGDYVQTPYHVGAEKAQKTLDAIDDNLKVRQNERMTALDEAPIAKIDLTDARNTAQKAFDDLNIAGIKDGEIIPKAGREALIDVDNQADMVAIKKLQEILADDVSPVQTMDRIKKLQEWVYENKTRIGFKGISDRMESTLAKVQGSMNATFKKQLPPEYKEIMDSMSSDIQLKNKIKEVFGIDDMGNPIGNRGEGVMKRLANGTTTGGEARKLALEIKNRYGIDLIKEARLRQMAMDLVGDDRGLTLFGAITRGKSGIVDLAIQKTLGKIVNKEGVVRKLATGKAEVVKKQPSLYKGNTFRKNMAEEAKKPLALPAPKEGSKKSEGIAPILGKRSDKEIIDISKKEIKGVPNKTKETPKSEVPKTVKKEGVKNLTPTKESGKIGGMEDTKLIEEARKYKSAEEFIKNNSLKGNRITNNDNAYQKGGYDGVVHILEDADSVNLTLIELKEKGTGKGTEIVKNLKQYADAKDKKLKIINSSNDKYWDSFKFLEKGSDGRYVYKPNTKPFTVEGRRGLDYKTPKEMIGKVVSYEGKNYEITNFIYSDESGTLYFRIKGDSGNKIVTPDKLGDKIEGYIPNKEEVIIQNIKPKKIYGKKISKEDELHLFKKNTRK